MGKLTEEVFNESCCDGGAECNTNSAQPCGCDPGCKPKPYFCGQHLTELHELILKDSIVLREEWNLAPREIRITDPLTGGQKGQKLARFSLIPRDLLWQLAEHYGQRASKYSDRNWQKGYKWSLTVDAMDRHYNAWIEGEDNDPETGSSHLIAAAWHLVALWWFHAHGKGTDDIRRIT